MKTRATQALFTAALLLHIDAAYATEFEKLGLAVAKALGTKKAFKTSATIAGKPTTVFYAKDASGRATKFAVVQEGIYEPNCTHTWVVGVAAGSSQVSDVEVVEMACPHAFPCQKASFLEQYRGKGPADAKNLKSSVNTVAKATGTSNLTTDAVVNAIVAAQALKGKI